MEPCVSCIYLTYCMEYAWKSSLWIGIFQRAKQRARILLTDNIQSGDSCSVNRDYYLLLLFITLKFQAVFGVFSNAGAQKLNRGFLPFPLSLSPIFSPQFSFCEAVRIHSTKHKRFKSPSRREVANFCASRKQLIIKKYSSEIGLISTPW